MKNKEERYNRSIHSILFDIARSVYWDYHDRCAYWNLNTKQYKEYAKVADKAAELSKRIDTIKEVELCWLLSNLGVFTYYHGQRVESRLIKRQLYHKLNKVRPDSLNNNYLVRMLKNAKWLRMYFIQ